METCVRGFSFMSDSKVELVDLQYIEGGELERAWRSTRRERMKQREQKIWDEFVKEKDIVKDVCSDDPYQFLDQLPESCLKEIMENELQKMTKENAEEAKSKDLYQQGNGDNSTDDGQHTCVVTFADDIDKDDCEMFHIFDDEQSGGEEEVLNGSRSPSTVREKQEESASQNQSPERTNSLDKTSSKSSENVTNVIESSIYCAKVKDLRTKINEELIALMTSLDRRDILSAEPDDIARMIKRSAEFCTRFNRIYMYQLQRQIHDIKRNNSVSLPFAKHTQFQSQMMRIVSLHQNLLQSFQVFHKSFEQTCCVRESAAALGSLLAALRDATHMCVNVPPPKDFSAALDLYKDDMVSMCDKVDDFVSEYAIRCEEFLNSFENVSITYTNSKKMVKNKAKKRSFGPWTRNTTKNVADTEARLSMYSLDTLRLNLNARSSGSKENQLSGSSKMRSGAHAGGSNAKRGHGDIKNVEPPKSQRKSRRPLMRDPHAGKPRASRPTREIDIRTMVEAVETCASSHISREASPHVTPRRNKAHTPRRATHTPRSANNLHQPAAKKYLPPSAPITKHSNDSSDSKQKTRSQSPNTTALKVTLSSMKTGQEPVDISQVTPVCKIQCAMKKELEVDCGLKYGNSRIESSPKKSTSPSRIREDTTEKKDRERNKCAVKKDLDLDGRPKSPYLCSIVSGSSKRGASPSRIREDASEKKDRERNKGVKDCSQSKPNKKQERPKSPYLCNLMPNSPKRSWSPSQTRDDASDNTERELIKISTISPDRCEVTRLLKQLCSGDTSGTERITGAKNAQLLYVSGASPRQPSTPQLLRILEETIQKKVPKPLFQKPIPARGPDRYRLVFNIADKTADTLFQYRTKFVQHMLTSALYANSAVGKPWEMIGSVSEQIIDELLLGCMKEMELQDLLQEMYKKETS